MAKLFTPNDPAWVDEELVEAPLHKVLDDTGTAIPGNVTNLAETMAAVNALLATLSAGAKIELATEVTVAGTSLTAARMNNVEEGLNAVDDAVNVEGHDAKTTPVDADEVNLWDSVASAWKSLSWANIKAGVEDALASIFAPISGSENYMPNVAPGTSGNVLTSDGTDWTSAAPSGGGGGAVTNLLINGGFDFFQRITPATATAMSDDVYNAPDMWYSLVQGANATINRNAGIGTSKYSCKLVAGGTTNRYGIAQIKESADSIPLRGKEVITQILIKPVNNAGSGTRKYRIAILEWTGTADLVTSELVADWTSGTFTTAGFFASTTLTLVATASVTATHNTETQLSCTGTVSASCNNLIVFIWVEDVPTHASDYVLIGEAGLYTASTVQEWSPKPNRQELALCQAFYEKSYNVDVAPGGSASEGQYDFRGVVAAAAFIMCPIRYKVEKAGTPIVTVYDAAGNINKASYVTTTGGAQSDNQTVTVDYIGTSGARSYTDNTTSKVGLKIHWTIKFEL